MARIGRRGCQMASLVGASTAILAGAIIGWSQFWPSGIGVLGAGVILVTAVAWSSDRRLARSALERQLTDTDAWKSPLVSEAQLEDDPDAWSDAARRSVRSNTIKCALLAGLIELPARPSLSVLDSLARGDLPVSGIAWWALTIGLLVGVVWLLGRLGERAILREVCQSPHLGVWE